MQDLGYYMDAEEQIIESIEAGGPDVPELHRALSFARRRIAVILVMAGLLGTSGCFDNLGKAVGGFIEATGEVVKAVGTEIVSVTEAE